jgi:hypothetical protein
MRLMLLGTVLLALTAACSGSDPVTVAQPSATTASATASSPTVVAAAPGTGAGSSTPATPTPVVAPTQQPRPAATSAAPPQPRDGDLDGSPLSTIDVRVAVEDGRGYSFWLVDDERPQLCPASAVPGRAYWSANLQGSDFGPVFVLWVYSDADAVEADWAAEVGEAPAPKFDCELPSGFVYWNENLILAFDVWLSVGQSLPLHEHWESPSDMPAALAFLELTP